MTTYQAAIALGITRAAVLKRIAAGTLKATKEGRDWRILPRDIEAARTVKKGRRPKKEARQ